MPVLSLRVVLVIVKTTDVEVVSVNVLRTIHITIQVLQLQVLTFRRTTGTGGRTERSLLGTRRRGQQVMLAYLRVGVGVEHFLVGVVRFLVVVRENEVVGWSVSNCAIGITEIVFWDGGGRWR